MIKNLLLPNLWGYLEHDFIKIPYRPIPNQGLELFPIERTGGPSPVLGHKRWTSSPLQVLNFQGQVWTAGTVLPVLPIPACDIQSVLKWLIRECASNSDALC